MKEKKCVLCGDLQQPRLLYPATITTSKGAAKLYSARRPADTIHFQINICDRCGLVFSSPIFSADTIQRFYHQSVCTYEELVPFTTRTYERLVVPLRKKLPRQPRVLEIGCGTGFFLERLRRSGVKQVWGVEPGQAMVERAPHTLRRRIKRSFFRRGLFGKDSFDLVACFHTLDHMLEPNAAVKAMYEVLKPGGIALIVVHDSAGWSVKILGEKSPIFDVEHIYLFNKQTLGSLFEKHGFVVDSVSNVVNTYPLAYWVSMAGLPARLTSEVLWLLKAMGVATKPVSLAAGNMALMAHKPKL